MRLIIFLCCWNKAHNAISPWNNWTLSINAEDSDLLIGYIFDLRGTYPNSLKCSDINNFNVVLLESVVYATKRVNTEVFKKHNLSLGVIGFDACTNTQIAYQKGIRFIEGKDTCSCQSVATEDDAIMRQKSTSECIDPKDSQVHMVTGLLNSEMSVGLSPLFGYFCIPLVSSYATSNELSKHEEVYPYFLGTSPPNRKLMECLIDLLLRFNWTVVNLVYDQSEYGIDLFNDFKSVNEARDKRVCVRISQALQLSKRESWPNESHLQKWHEDTEVIVLLADYMSSTDFFKIIKNSNLQFQLIGSQGWASMRNVMMEVEAATVNAIALDPLLKDDVGFRAYLSDLTMDTPNPWMRAMIADQYKCWMKEMDNCPGKNCPYQEPCTLNKKLKMDEVDPMAIWRSHFVIEVIDLFARAVENICLSNVEHCKKRPQMFINGKVLLDQILSTTLDDDLAKFQWDGRSGRPEYSVMQFIWNETAEQYEWQPIGEYINGSLKWSIMPTFNQSLMQSIRSKVSKCQQSCNISQIQSYLDSTGCCIKCESCPSDKGRVLNNQCVNCSKFHYAFKNVCVRRPSMIFFTHDGYNLAMFILSLVGLLVSVLLAVLFLIKRNTPIVQVLFGRTGLLLIPAVTILFLSATLNLTCPAIKSVCVCNVYMWAMALTVAFSVLCAKVIRAHICNNIEMRAIPLHRYCSPDMERSTISVLTCSLVAFHVIFFMWLGYVDCPSVISQMDIKGETKFLVCSVTKHSYTLLNLAPMMVLLIVTGIFGYRGRDSTLLVFRLETKRSLIASMGVALSFVVTLPLQLLTSEAELMGIASSCSSLIPALVLLFMCLLPPTYTILWRPYKNNFKSLARAYKTRIRQIGGGGVYHITIEEVPRQNNPSLDEPISTTLRL